MINKLKISIFSMLVCAASLSAQSNGGNSTDGTFKPQKGNWQISVNLGNGDFMPTEDLEYLLPDNKLGSGTLPDLGLGWSGSANQSQAIGVVLNTGSFNNNSLTNIASLEFGYFVTDLIQVNASFCMDLASNPSKDYLEGVEVNPGTSDPLDIPGYEYMEATISSKYMAKVGGNYYFSTKSDRVQLYAGLAATYAFARMDAQTPYTGVEFGGDPVELYQPSNRVGFVQSVSALANVGVEYGITENLNIGFEVSPISYTTSMLAMQLQGFAPYYAVHDYVKAFAFPTVKLGIRF